MTLCGTCPDPMSGLQFSKQAWLQCPRLHKTSPNHSCVENSVKILPHVCGCRLLLMQRTVHHSNNWRIYTVELCHNSTRLIITAAPSAQTVTLYLFFSSLTSVMNAFKGLNTLVCEVSSYDVLSVSLSQNMGHRPSSGPGCRKTLI